MDAEQERDAMRPAQRRRAVAVACAECASLSGLRWSGWRAYRVDDPETDSAPVLAFFCPACAEREFGHRAGRRVGP